MAQITPAVDALRIKIDETIQQAKENYAFLERSSKLSSAEFTVQQGKTNEVERQQRVVLTALRDDLSTLRTLHAPMQLVSAIEQDYSDLIRRHDQVQPALIRRVREEQSGRGKAESNSISLGERAQLLASEGEMSARLGQETQREEDLKRLEADIEELQAIYTQLAAQIGEQGKQLDLISDHVDTSYDEVDSAQRALEKAEEHRRRKRRFWLILGLVIGGVLVILLVVILIEVLQ